MQFIKVSQETEEPKEPKGVFPFGTFVPSVSSGTSPRGFTLTELIIVISIFASLMLLATISLINAKQKASLTTSVDVLIGDLRQQQLKALVGDTEGSGAKSDFGVHFNTTAYVLFRGSSYNSGDPDNFSIPLGDSIEVVGGVSDIIFQQISGDPAGGTTTIVLQDGATGEQRTIVMNRYGVVTAVN